MVNHLHRDPPGLRLRKRARGIAVEALPRLAVDFILEGRLERLVGVAGAEEVRMTDEEALLVVVGVDEPGGDALGSVPVTQGGSVHVTDNIT